MIPNNRFNPTWKREIHISHSVTHIQFVGLNHCIHSKYYTGSQENNDLNNIWLTPSSSLGHLVQWCRFATRDADAALMNRYEKQQLKPASDKRVEVHYQINLICGSSRFISNGPHHQCHAEAEIRFLFFQPSSIAPSFSTKVYLSE